MNITRKILLNFFNRAIIEVLKDRDKHTIASYLSKIPREERNKVDYVSTLTRFKYCQCGEEILDNICTEEQIISGCFDISKNSDRLLLKNLEDTKCITLKNDIQTKGGYSKVFDIGFDMVHKMSLGILIVLCAVGAAVVLNVISKVLNFCCGEGAELIIAPCALCIMAVYTFNGLANFVLFIILIVNYYKGTTIGEFLDFYNICLDANEQNSLKIVSNALEIAHLLRF